MENLQNLLVLAASQGCVDEVKLLLKQGADPNIKDNHGKTALMVAADMGYLEIVSILLKNKADLYKKDREDNSAIKIATDEFIESMPEAEKYLGEINEQQVTIKDFLNQKNQKS